MQPPQLFLLGLSARYSLHPACQLGVEFLLRFCSLKQCGTETYAGRVREETTQTPTTSDGHDDTGVAALVGSSGKTLCFYWGTRCWVLLIQPMSLKIEGLNTGEIKRCYLNSIRPLECQCMRHVKRLRREKAETELIYILYTLYFEYNS